MLNVVPRLGPFVPVFAVGLAAAPVVELLAQAGVLAGVPVSRLEPGNPACSNLIVLAATELTTDTDIEMLADCLSAALREDLQ